jgi:beta-lactamase superfamily II metal-dependent hydrolase
MEVKFLKAGRGDAILVSSNKENMLVDGGDDSNELLLELDEIHKRKETLKYLIITHHDSDHIAGILHIMDELESGRYGKPNLFIQKLLFNSPNLLKKTKDEEKKSIDKRANNNLSYKQAFTVEERARMLEIQCDLVYDTKNRQLNLGEVIIECLSPNLNILENYLKKTPEKYLLSKSKGDWGKSLSELVHYATDQSLDNSKANETSVVLLIKHQNKKGLLTGDVTPKRLKEIVDFLFLENDKKRVQLDFIKLPHHGSSRSVSREILSKLSCKEYIITTNGQNNFLPNKKVILKIHDAHDKKVGKIKLKFNYPELVKKLNISETEMKNYDLEIH